MTTLLILKILLILYLLQALLKFIVHFTVKYETRIKRISAAYSNEGRRISLFDDIILVVMLIFIGLLFVSGGMEYLSFTTGLLIGMTLIQVYFHRFRDPLPPDRSPEPPVTPIKHMSMRYRRTPGRRGENTCS